MHPIGMLLKHRKSRTLNQLLNGAVRHYGHAPAGPDHPEKLAKAFFQQKLLGSGQYLGRSAIGRVQDGGIYAGASQGQALGVSQQQSAIQVLQVA
jgi:predicted membrane GTPase involved in stress response